MKIWNQAPLVRLILPFIAGILTAIYFPCYITNFWLIIAPYILSVAGIVLVPAFKISFRKSWILGFVINLLLFSLAYQLTIFKTEKFDRSHFAKVIEGKSFVHARLIQSSIEKEKSYKMVMEVMSVKSGTQWIPVTGKAMVYIKKDQRSAHLQYGDEVLLNTGFNEIPFPGNPGEFDYKKFLGFHNIYQQAMIAEKDWEPLGINSGNPILKYSYGLRDDLLNVLRRENVKDDEFAVGAALMLGYADKLDAEIISAYSGTGALHVLSVSGLHVAIVYIVFNWLLFFLDKIKYGSAIKAVILILLLWFYSALTGLSPSVLRSAAMFSFIIIAKAFNRHTNIYNTLAASVFVLLAINPYLIMDVGFQLSYIAVIGIVYIQPKIYQLFEPESWLLEQVWTITAVSIAAQIATFPLGLYYFHQFPNYFLVSNFIVIPVSTVIMYAGIALFAFAKIPVIAGYIAWGFNWSVWLLNASVKLIEKWPYALIQGVSISFAETCLIYAMIVLCFFYFTRQQVKYLISAFSILVLILSFQIFQQQQELGRKRIIVYDIPKTSAIDFISAKNNYLYTDSIFAKNESGLAFHIKHNWWYLGITNSTILTADFQSEELDIKNNTFQFKNKKMVILNEGNFTSDTSKTGMAIKIDYLIISKNAKISIAGALKLYQPEEIIFDSSNSKYRIEKWKKECVALSQMYYSVSDSGAFVADL